MKTKQRLRLEIKEVTAEGYFEGLLSPYNNVDLGGDMVEPGAYTKTLLENGDKIPMLWQHKADCPIGDLQLEDRPEGLWCKGQLLMSLELAQNAYLLIKAGVVKGLSIGFETVKSVYVGTVRHIKEIRLWEGSVVTFPMNQQALIAAVKGLASKDSKDFNAELAEIQLYEAGCQIRSALGCALSALIYSGLGREEVIAESLATIQQFSDAYMSYLPQYLDLITAQYGSMETYAAAKREEKAGARHSAATKTSLGAIHEHMKSATDLLSTLLDDEADDDNEELSAVTPELKAVAEPEPVKDHSAAAALGAMREFVKKAKE